MYCGDIFWTGASNNQSSCPCVKYYLQQAANLDLKLKTLRESFHWHENTRCRIRVMVYSHLLRLNPKTTTIRLQYLSVIPRSVLEWKRFETTLKLISQPHKNSHFRHQSVNKTLLTARSHSNWAHANVKMVKWSYQIDRLSVMSILIAFA